MSAQNMSYKLYHENYMSNHKGSSLWESVYLIVPFPILIYFSSYFVNKTLNSTRSLPAFLLEFLIFVTPLVLFYTIANEFISTFMYALIFIFILSFANTVRSNKRLIKIVLSLVLPRQKRPYITYFRSICYLLTAFCILAVDFTIFPRRFAKTETYGFGLMDTGVGFFIVSNGLVTKSELRQHLLKSIKSTIPIAALGIIRCMTVNALDYQQHVSEYGVFWNFFFTLAVVMLMCPLILSLWPNGSAVLSIIFLVFHQFLLSSGIEEWVVSDIPREGILSANREGIVSLPGYFSLYFASVYIGRVLSRDNVDLQYDFLMILKLFLASGVFFFLTLVLLPRFNVSRRLINVTYIMWILAMTLLILGVALMAEISLRIMLCLEGKINAENLTPIIVDAVNYNGLLFFILANLLTGAINISLKTLLIDTPRSLLVLFVYMLFLCYVVSFLYRYRIRIKL